MFSSCADPKSLSDFLWMACYLTSGKQLAFYSAFGTVLALLAITAPIALAFGFGGAVAARSHILPLRWFGKVYTAMVRGIPDIVFFLFVPIAMDQGLEYLKNRAVCPAPRPPVWQGSEFHVCAAAKIPVSTAAPWVFDVYNFGLAVVAFAIVFGAFTANVISGAMKSVPAAQMETAEAYGMSERQAFWRILVPQMWVYALPGLSNIWQILVKATPLLFLLGIQDIVYWARELGGVKTRLFAYPHGDWRLWYFLALLVFYLLLTSLSERVFARIMRRLSHGQATAAGEAARRAAA